MMKRKLQVVTMLLLTLFLLSGCSATRESTDPKESVREVSPAFRGFGESGLLVNKGELKESRAEFPDTPAEFQDPVVEEMLRNLIGKPEGEVLHSDLEEIHAIYWRGHYWSNLQSTDGTLPKDENGPWETKQPETLEDFALCSNLQWMEFGGIEVPFLAPLSSLLQLETIAFHNVKATKERMEELALFSNLKALEINGVRWEGAGNPEKGEFLIPLADRLTYLDLSGETECNPEIYSRMTNLESLCIDGASDLSFLKNLTKLKELVIYASTAEDWSPLGSLKNLEYLSICGNMYHSSSVTLDDLRPLSQLDYLSLGFTKADKKSSRNEIIEALPGLTGLHIL